MKKLLQIVFISFFIISAIITLHVFALKSFISDSNNLISLLEQNALYESAASAISNTMQEEDGGTPIQVSSSQVKSIVLPVVKQSLAYITGTQSTPPSFSIESMMNSLAQSQGFNTKELLDMKNQMAKEIQESKDPESQEFMKSISNLPSSFSFDSQLTGLRSIYTSLQLLPFISLSLSIVWFILLLLVTSTIKGKVFVTSLVSFLMLCLVGIGYVSLSRIPLSTIATLVSTNSFTSIILPVLLIPYSQLLQTYHQIAVIVFAMIAVITFLARMMLFPSQSKEVSSINKKK